MLYNGFLRHRDEKKNRESVTTKIGLKTSNIFNLLFLKINLFSSRNYGALLFFANVKNKVSNHSKIFFSLIEF